MTQFQMQEYTAPTIDSMFDKLIRTIGGKRIQKLTIICFENNDLTSSDSMSASIQNAVLLKRSSGIHFLGYNSNNCATLFFTPKHEIDALYLYQSGKKEYELMLRDHLNWHLRIVLA